jgi:hypothetical protein
LDAEIKMKANNEPVSLSEVVDSEAFIRESARIYFDPLGEGWFEGDGLEDMPL